MMNENPGNIQSRKVLKKPIKFLLLMKKNHRFGTFSSHKAGISVQADLPVIRMEAFPLLFLRRIKQTQAVLLE